ncbi:hypothetical protein SAMN02910447_03028 [Ruminococcus sp. YE71]|uniref:hypothetical protein n=1 Tax=unclassified Ruminococcus TaxID=2608920 RepID=UPI00088FD4F8|nr:MULTISPECIES: hypothetical protein [unclassified Ruminococcus]SDA29348.1 hypothetical protein SAMN02910446_03099 [Ruminococcus sp. YE78]SFW48077.1 hypothetical protein SAMN02910447_03028 [Ruminococcus sp. YE71]
MAENNIFDENMYAGSGRKKISKIVVYYTDGTYTECYVTAFEGFEAPVIISERDVRGDTSERLPTSAKAEIIVEILGEISDSCKMRGTSQFDAASVKSMINSAVREISENRVITYQSAYDKIGRGIGVRSEELIELVRQWLGGDPLPLKEQIVGNLSERNRKGDTKLVEEFFEKH